MGLLDFLKPRKDRLQELANQPEMRKAILSTELEFTQKQIANLRAVGREAEAERLLSNTAIRWRVSSTDFPGMG
jgi:hypothetical protein